MRRKATIALVGLRYQMTVDGVVVTKPSTGKPREWHTRDTAERYAVERRFEVNHV